MTREQKREGIEQILTGIEKIIKDATSADIKLRTSVVKVAPSGEMFPVCFIGDESSSIREQGLQLRYFDECFDSGNSGMPESTRKKISEILAEHFQEGHHRFVLVVE